MQIITKELNGIQNEDLFSYLGKAEEILALDVETCHLSKEESHIYLIGCAFCSDHTWKLIQWIDETGTEESDILTSFFLFVKKFKIILDYRGEEQFIPILKKKMNEVGLYSASHDEEITRSMKWVDLYSYVKPFRRILSLPDLKEQTVEKFFGTGRKENLSPKERDTMYQNFIANEDQSTNKNELLSKLLSQNEDDVVGVIAISNIFSYADLFTSSLDVYKAQANTYRNAEGELSQELLLYARVQTQKDSTASPSSFVLTAHAHSCYAALTGKTVTIKVPIFNGRIRYFYANYKDYYYLPELDQAVHKSISDFVAKSRRVQATKETCYTTKVGSFLPEWSSFRTPLFKQEYGDKTAWFEFLEDMKKDKNFFSDYATYVYHHILSCSKES